PSVAHRRRHRRRPDASRGMAQPRHAQPLRRERRRRTRPRRTPSPLTRRPAVKRRDKKYADGLAHTFGAGTALILVARCQEWDGAIPSLLGAPTREAWRTEIPADWRVAGRVLLWARQRPEANPDLPRAEARRRARQVTGSAAGAEVDVFRPGGVVPLADLD